MVNLPISHPRFHEHLERGAWTVQRLDENPFSSIPADQAIEQTFNRQSKCSGGLVGFTLNRGKYKVKQFYNNRISVLKNKTISIYSD